MLDQMRRGVGNWLAKGLLGLLIIAFSVWGVGDYIGKVGRPVPAKIGGTEITAEQYRQAYQEEINALSRRLGRLPRFADWADARRADAEMLTEWQVYRMFDSRRGAWATFQFLVRGRLLDEGADVRSDGSLAV